MGGRNRKPEETAGKEGNVGKKHDAEVGREGQVEEEEVQSSRTDSALGERRGRKRREGERAMLPPSPPAAPYVPVGDDELHQHALTQLEELRKEMGKIREEARKGKAIEEPIWVSPFSAGVLADKLPSKFWEPNFTYDGTVDPEEHLGRFEHVALLHQYTDGVKCRIFLTTLTKATRQ